MYIGIDSACLKVLANSIYPYIYIALIVGIRQSLDEPQSLRTDMANSCTV